ncbi:MAG: two-component system, OmpR family, sensor kinase, partial [Solirubrobacteraceae bacterium]|nr:two-component system, OmpR family, sensor kinase [Solirubrobacteraceae bacterium]
MSLRARLILTLVLLAGSGLLVLGAVTYAALRSYELDRVDQQATAAVGQAEREFERTGLDDGVALRPPPGGFGHDAHDGQGGGIGLAPAGTYAQQRDDTGAAVGSPIVLALPPGETRPAAPRLPARLS